MLLPLCCFCLWGCKSPLDVSNLKTFGRTDGQLAAVDDDTRSPLERIMQAVGRGRQDAARRNYRSAEGIAAYDEAKALFDEGNYKAAEKDFKRIAKKYQDSQIEEDALFMLAESRFERKRYSWAQDGYDALFEKYPSTRYATRATQRLFTIARIWLEFPEIVTSDDIQQVDFTDLKSTPTPKSENKSRFQLTRAVPILPNFIDRKRPVFDTEGRALQALKSIWLNDPTGPLADDALMLTASYHLRNNDHMEAARIYKILREMYPNSRHIQNAFVLGSHVRLMSYQGPGYDGKALDEAQQLKDSTLKLFPNTRDRERLQADLRQIEEAKAERDWGMVEFWQKKRKPRAVAVYCREIIEKYPDTSYVARAREKLDELRAQAANPPSFREKILGRVPRLRRARTSDLDVPVAPAFAPDIPIVYDSEPDIPIITDPQPGFGRRLLQRLPAVPKLFGTPSSGDAEAAGNSSVGL
jgi:outer membrane protein assembly factor BamD (BamD/ComL family)